MWTHGYADTWIHGHVDTWMLVLDSHEPLENFYIITSNLHVFARILLGFWKSFMDTWIHGYVDTWTHGYADTWVHGHVDTWILVLDSQKPHDDFLQNY